MSCGNGCNATLISASRSKFMSREIKLSGSEITILKTLGFGGTPTPGKLLIERVDEFEPAEFIDTLEGLMAFDYVLSDKVNVRTMVDIEKAAFRVNPVHARDLKEAVTPGRKRDDRGRRQRRR